MLIVREQFLGEERIFYLVSPSVEIMRWSPLPSDTANASTNVQMLQIRSTPWFLMLPVSPDPP